MKPCSSSGYKHEELASALCFVSVSLESLLLPSSVRGADFVISDTFRTTDELNRKHVWFYFLKKIKKSLNVVQTFSIYLLQDGSFVQIGGFAAIEDLML